LQSSRLGVIIGSILIAVVGTAIYSVDRFQRVHVPLWDDLLLVYGGVFVIFLLFDSIGKQVAGFRKESHATLPRPQPSPSAQQSQRAYVRPGRVQLSDVRLERVKTDGTSTHRLQAYCDEGFEELAALNGTTPNRDSRGHVMAAPVSSWITDAHRYLFFISHQQKSVGCVVLKREEERLHVELLYVIPDVRRTGIGRVAVQKLVEFMELLGGHEALWLQVSSDNARGQKFAKTAGFHHAGELANDGEATYVLGLEK
jgi:ribosomal protein S18 acetylase RimI-like enzyme